ncbi:MAG: T9SS type A sorting domain-containing protein [Chitinophagales bacterium]
MWYTRAAFILLFYGFCMVCIAQKEDYYWVKGYGPRASVPDTGVNRSFGATILNFNVSPVDTIRFVGLLNMYRTNASFCDSAGQIQLYTNGVQVYNRNNVLMDNGDSLNAGYMLYEYDPWYAKNGYFIQQGALVLKQPGDLQLWHIFHTYRDSSNELGLYYYDKLYRSVADMQWNGGLGKIVSKNIPHITDTIGGDISACRHSNGQSWWIISQESGTNCYYRTLLDSSGVHLLPDKNCDGAPTARNEYSVSTFTPDGTKYIRLSQHFGLQIFNFNRCTGMLSHPVSIPLHELIDSFWFGLGVAVSPNSRYLYASVTSRVYQYDLFAGNVAASKQVIAIYDGFADRYCDSCVYFETRFESAQLAPDGKIYIETGNGTRYLHVIDYPDSAGAACQFRQHGFRVPTWNSDMPNFPNWRLGAAVCQTGLPVFEPLKFQVFPNPFSEQIAVDYAQVDWTDKAFLQLAITDIYGKRCYESTLSRFSAYQSIPTGQLQSGAYFIHITDDTWRLMAVKKCIKE